MENIISYKCQRVGIVNCGVCLANWTNPVKTNKLCESCLAHILIFSSNTNDCPTCNGRYYFKCISCDLYYCGCDFQSLEIQEIKKQVLNTFV